MNAILDRAQTGQRGLEQLITVDEAGVRRN